MFKKVNTILAIIIITACLVFSGQLYARVYLKDQVYLNDRQDPEIHNVTMTTADTEYEFAIATSTTKLLIKLRDPGATLKLSYEENKSGTVYLTIPAGATKSLDNVYFNSKTLYFQSPTASQIAEIEIVH